MNTDERRKAELARPGEGAGAVQIETPVPLRAGRACTSPSVSVPSIRGIDVRLGLLRGASAPRPGVQEPLVYRTERNLRAAIGPRAPSIPCFSDFR